MKLGNRYSQHSFAITPDINVPRSAFNRSFASKTTFDFDYLVPFFVDEILPGDTINLNVNSFIRLASQVVPAMDNMYVDFYFFFVPNRLVWNNFQKFMGEQEDPGDSIDFLVPQISTSEALPNGSIWDQYGLPTDVTPSTFLTFNALIPRSYNLIYNEWFRDQNLQNSISVPKGDGPDTDLSVYQMRKGNKKHDYFASALPWPQKGDPVSLPITGTIPLQSNGPLELHRADPNPTPTPRYDVSWSSAGAGFLFLDSLPGNSPQTWYADGIEGNLTDGDISTTINQFRQAMMLQSFLENDARGGTRYVEILRSHFNVIAPDFRLQRPEFLSGGTINISQHVVAQTSESDQTPLGTLAAFSTSANLDNSIGFSKSFVEHGHVIGICKARADITYQQGINRMWERRTKHDFFWPEFQQLGEQAVYTKEIRYAPSYINEIFGYQERHAEYRYRPSEIKGQFRSNYTETLDVWHLAQEFETEPSLSSEFIQLNTPIERILEVTEGYPHLKADFWFNYRHVRPMVARPKPATLGRF